MFEGGGKEWSNKALEDLNHGVEFTLTPFMIFESYISSPLVARSKRFSNKMQNFQRVFLINDSWVEYA